MIDKMLFVESLNVKTISEEGNKGIFDIEGLYRGYGLTIGNAIRRVLLSSLPGSAIVQVKIKGVDHEFSTIEGVIEDIVEIVLNLKKVRFQFDSDTYGDQEILNLKAKGEGKITAKNIQSSGRVKVVNPDQHIATITEKNTEVEMEVTVEKGMGYVAVESFKQETLPVGVIKIDALFSPVKRVNFTVENMRVADRTDFNKVRFSIETDGGISPTQALNQSLVILKDHFTKAIETMNGLVDTTEKISKEKNEEKNETKEEELVEEPKEKKSPKKKVIKEKK
jgi:DNA-directed RNA polymerase subunit alpha